MEATDPEITTVEAYIAAQPEPTRVRLEQIRALIHELVPEVTEVISYKIAGFRLKNHALIHLAGYKGHIGFYPAPSEPAALAQALAPYLSGKSTIKFPLSQPLPMHLIRDLIEYKAQHISTLASSKRKRV